MPIPAGVETVTVTASEPLTLPDGTPMQGQILFTGPDLFTVADDNFVAGGAVRRTLTNGVFSDTTLVATDATGVSPTGWTYRVDLLLSNGPSWTRYISLPKVAPLVNLADILVPDPVAGAFTTLVDPSTVFSTGTGDVVGKARVVDKASDTQSTTLTLSDDPHLTIAVAANARYSLDLFLDVDGDTAGDFSLGWTAPAGATMSWTESGPSAGNSNNIANIKYNRLSASDTGSIGILPTGTVCTPSGRLATTTAGTLTLRWGQTGTSGAPAGITTLRTGSWLRLHRIA